MENVKELIKILESDFQDQLNSLSEKNELSWDCYNSVNWDSMLYTLNQIKEKLK